MGFIPYTLPQGSKTSHHVPLQQRCQSVGSVTGLCSAWPLPPEGALQIVMSYEPPDCTCPILLECPSTLAQGPLPAGVLLVPEKSDCQGVFSRHWGSVCGNKGCCQELIFFPKAPGKLIPFQCTRSGFCSSVLGSDIPHAHLRLGLQGAGHTRMVSLVVVITQRWAPVSILWV